jgi:ectoine hydroxylase
MQIYEVLKQEAKVLSAIQRQEFFSQGFLVLESIVGPNWLRKLNDAQQELIDRSRGLTESDATYQLEAGHSADNPRLHRITSPQDAHPAFWDFLVSEEITRLVADLVGPDVKFHHAKLNTKAERGSAPFFWHQDFPGWPHTDFSPVTVGVYLKGCTAEQGPLGFLPGSHTGPLYDQYDDQDRVIPIPQQVLDQNKDKLVYPTGGPGTVVLLNCRVVHGSGVNTSDAPRPLLLSVYSSADSFPYTPNPLPSRYSGQVVRGKPARFASFDLRPCRVPPAILAAKKGLWSKPGTTTY